MQIETSVSMYRKQAVSVVLGAALFSAPSLLAQSSQTANGSSLPNEASAQTTVSSTRSISSEESPSLLGTPKRIVVGEVHIVLSPARLRTHDLIWLLPVAGATAASLKTDTRVMRDVVSHDPGFNASASTSSAVLRGPSIGGPVVLYGVGHFVGNAKAKEAGLLAGEAMVYGYITSEGIKYISLRERPNLQNARGYFFQTDAASDPSFVSGHSIVAWSSAAVLASEYSRPWQQIWMYALATGASLTRVLGQDHFPTDVLLGSVSGWLIGRYVFRAHHTHPHSWAAFAPLCRDVDSAVLFLCCHKRSFVMMADGMSNAIWRDGLSGG